MKLALFTLCLLLHIVAHAQTGAVTLQNRLKEGDSNLYGHWTLNPLDSRLGSQEFILKEIVLIKDPKGLTHVDSILQRHKGSFFDIEIYPLEKMTITHFGRGEAIVVNPRNRTLDKQPYYFINAKFSQRSTMLFFPIGGKDSQDPFTGTVEIHDGRTLSIQAGRSNFIFQTDNDSISVKPKALNNIQTSWNENGLSGKVREILTKRFSLQVENGDIMSRRPNALTNETYSEEGLQVHWKESERSIFIEKNTSGSYMNKTVKEYRNNQDMTIINNIKTTGTKATMESFVQGVFANKREFEFENGRIIKERMINYLKEVELDLTHTYNKDGHLYSTTTSYPKQDLANNVLYKYIQFDSHGNWTERLVYWEYTPKYHEVRELEYY